MTGFTVLESRIAVLPRNDIDTDQIIPARFLKVTDKVGLGAKLFADWRGPDFVLDRPEAAGVQVLVAGDNFGCGSSREHAPWALVDWGLRAVISTSFADIFRNNALKNGLLPVEVDADAHAELIASPWQTVRIDLPAQTLALPSGRIVEFPIDPFAKRCLVDGTDQLGYLLSLAERIAAYERRREAGEEMP
ncbi:MAG: 3-isopropylmalate dehydratase small subunit [Deltaproteobacteria bacterium]|nr:MAG: 3-isopropylmalate dehydratase small subunit [Deltaproteobacteria bacterium]